MSAAPREEYTCPRCNDNYDGETRWIEANSTDGEGEGTPEIQPQYSESFIAKSA